MLDIILSKTASNLVKQGFPWVYKKDIENKNSSFEIAEAGELCRITDEKGKPIATGYFNSNTNIAVRILTLDPKEKIDKNFFKMKIVKAIEKRKKYFAENYFRAVYGESDGLPGLIIDIYGNIGVAQVNAAGIDRLKQYWLPALLELFPFEGVYLDGSSRHRIREGLKAESEIIFGKIPDLVAVKENDFSYYADIIDGQKTGWFYDQRDNRKFLASLSKNKTVLDLYTHSGGFGLLCAKEGAISVELVDRSEISLNLAKAAVKNWHDDGLKFTKSEAFNYLEMAIKENKKFDIVNADPPAFIKNKKDIEVGLKGYEKLTRKCLGLINAGGLFAISSCSYFARPEPFQKVIEKTLEKSGRKFKLLRKSGADKDHPIHPMLAETNYLKFLVYKLD